MGFSNFALVAQLVEHVLGKDEVTGSIPVGGLRVRRVNLLLFNIEIKCANLLDLNVQSANV